jgi:hypothetical protein
VLEQSDTYAIFQWADEILADWRIEPHQQLRPDLAGGDRCAQGAGRHRLDVAYVPHRPLHHTNDTGVIAISPSLTNDAPLCVKGTIIGHPSPTGPRLQPLRQLTWGKFNRHI